MLGRESRQRFVTTNPHSASPFLFTSDLLPPSGDDRLLIDFALAKGLAHEAFGHAAESDSLDSSILGDGGRFKAGERFMTRQWFGGNGPKEHGQIYGMFSSARRDVFSSGLYDAEPGERPWNRIALFNAHARNKRSVTLDLRQESGREALLRLAEQCDLMIENNSVDLIDKLGIGWDELRARNPRLILIRMPSVGLTGPYREYLGFGVNFEGLCGLTSLRGYAGDDLDRVIQSGAVGQPK